MKRLVCLTAAAWVLAASHATAQSIEEQVRKLVATYPPVTFVAEPKASPEGLGPVSNTVFKPAGDGPFPAVVLVHTCGGIDDLHMRQHARELLDAGMVVLMQDSFGPRGRRNCGINNSQSLPTLAGVTDAYAALAHLRNYPFVDKGRIYLAGYSWGGFVATLLASGRNARMVNATERFTATVANYSPCVTPQSPLVGDGTDRPLLMLLGEKDDETPPASCFPLLEQLKAKGVPVSWHLYPKTTHGWDKQGMARNGYIYDAEVAKDATRRMVEFFAQNK